MSQEAVVAEVAPDSITGNTSHAGTVTVIGQQHSRLREMVRSIAMEADDNASDEFVMGLMEEILAAESFDEIFAAQEKGMLSGQDYTMQPFLLKGDNIVWKKSRHSSFPYYAVMTVTEIGTGEERTLNCGGMTFVAVLRALEMKGYFNESPDGMPLVLKSTESPNGAYLSLLPYKGAAKPAAAARGKK